VVHTHELVFAGSVLTKRYTSWGRGEHRREWAALRLIHRYQPGLAPEPVSARLDAVPPEITMTVVPGEPLPGRPTAAQTAALATAISTLWTVPVDGLDPPGDVLDFARRLTAGPRPAAGATAAAYDAAVGWWDGPDPELLTTTPDRTVLGHRDPNLANYLWDGTRVRIVDLEDAAASDPAMELAILVEHLSARELDAEALCAHIEAHVDAHVEAHVDPVRLRAARRLWAMYWLRLLLPGGPAERRNPAGTADAQACRLLALLSS